MKAKTIKIGATAAVLVAALSGLMYTTLSEGTEYYKHVDEVMADPTAWQGKRMSLHGYVVDKSIFAKPDTLEIPVSDPEQRQGRRRAVHRRRCPTRSRTAPRSCSRDSWDRTASTCRRTASWPSARRSTRPARPRARPGSERRPVRNSGQPPTNRDQEQPCRHSVPSSFSTPSSPAHTPLRPRSPAPVAGRRGSSRAASARSISSPR